MAILVAVVAAGLLLLVRTGSSAAEGPGADPLGQDAVTREQMAAFLRRAFD